MLVFSVMETKTCTRCRQEKPLTAFSPQKGGALGRASRCKVCRSEAGTEQRRARVGDRQEESRRTDREAWYKRQAHNAGIPLAEYLRLRESPCDICTKQDNPVSPYMPAGRVVGWICLDCNMGLGKLSHDPAYLIRALRLLRGSKFTT